MIEPNKTIDGNIHATPTEDNEIKKLKKQLDAAENVVRILKRVKDSLHSQNKERITYLEMSEALSNYEEAKR
jgi:transketolase